MTSGHTKEDMLQKRKKRSQWGQKCCWLALHGQKQ